jgi:hypothetical protein
VTRVVITAMSEVSPLGLDALAAASPRVHLHAVPARDGDGVGQIEIIAEVAA